MSELIINPVNKEWLTGVLNSLGHTADEVAATLRAAGITGKRRNGVQCPTALYARAKAKERVPSASRVGVWVGWEAIWVRICRADRKDLVCVERPQAVSDFIEAFDSGSDYSDLLDDA
ncbi:hypothetical protein [Actinoallomurus acaciae]|uniref:Uncharacterized protein n=1 Tax=Actinoallomurus acaciae TaxID=502577 RepID=A0ABV5YFK6_9ACTN